MKRLIYFFMATVLCSGVVMAELPQPLVHLSFDQTWDNSGSAGAEGPSAPVDNNGFGPKFDAKGIIGYCLDTTGLVDPEDDSIWARLEYGTYDPENPTAIQQALAGLKSYTILFWYKFNDRSTFSGPIFMSRSQQPDDVYWANWAMYPIAEGNGLRILMNGFNNSGQGGGDMSWPTGIAYNKWMFMAATYNTDNFMLQLSWYQGLGNSPDDLYAKTAGDFGTPGEPLEGIAGAPLAIGAWTFNYVTDEETETEYETTSGFDGYIDEFRIYGSTADGSGALTEEQIQAIYEADLLTPRCGDENNPYPPGDLTGDCIVDGDDVAALASNWLADNAPAE
jgi:hypothetical protein